MPTDDWGTCAHTDDTYAEFAGRWRGVSAVPTLAEMNVAWTFVTAAQPELLLSGEPRRNAESKRQAKAIANDAGPMGKVNRALADVLRELVNAQRAWDRELKTRIAAAPATAAGIKAAIAAMPNLADITIAQVKAALANRIDDGAAD